MGKLGCGWVKGTPILTADTCEGSSLLSGVLSMQIGTQGGLERGVKQSSLSGLRAQAPKRPEKGVALTLRPRSKLSGAHFCCHGHLAQPGHVHWPQDQVQKRGSRIQRLRTWPLESDLLGWTLEQV